MKDLCTRIKTYRIEMHLSQEYVAKYLGINRATMTQIELGNRKVSAEELAQLSMLFGVSSDMLLHGRETSRPATMFARSFEKLDEQDQNEIMNLIRFKEMVRAQAK